MFDYNLYSFDVEVICRFQKRSFLSSLFKIQNKNKIFENSFILKRYYFLAKDEIEDKVLYLMSRISKKIEEHNDLYFLNKVMPFDTYTYNYILLEKKLKRGNIILREIALHNINFFKENLSVKDFLLLKKYLV